MATVFPPLPLPEINSSRNDGTIISAAWYLTNDIEMDFLE